MENFRVDETNDDKTVNLFSLLDKEIRLDYARFYPEDNVTACAEEAAQCI